MIHKQIQKAKELDPNTPWHSRGYLPHFNGAQITQFITYRLANSLPNGFLRTLKFKLDSRQISEIECHHEIENYLNKGHGPDHLEISAVATMIEENLLRFDGERYELLRWVIMPNHIHLLLRSMPGITLASIMHSLKSYTSNQANKALGLSGRFWSFEYFDRYIRDENHYAKTVAYIHTNPVKAGLCETAAGWGFGCARRHE